MKKIYRIITSWVVLLLPGITVAVPPVLLPLEVVGPDGYTVTVRFSLDDASGVDALYLKAHRLAYRDASTNPRRGAKGSVKLNDGSWIKLDNSTVNCYDHEAAYGCLSGAYHTVRLTVPIEGAVSGRNTLRFRFNGTDNFTSGYRILAFNLMQGDRRLLSDDSFVMDDPDAWQPPLDGADDIAQGKALWETASLIDYPGGPTINATCSGCHPADGRDLEYYAFSNWSIQERAKFHGLDQTQAEQIASYIRSLKDSKGVARLGRPWNPPYQPGPGLDSKPVEAWAAGAGLEWVLDQDEQMLPYLFPEGTSEQAMRKVISTQSTLNAREIPISMQFPDWQSWLPDRHPQDVFGPRWQNGIDGISPRQVYQDVLAYLDLGVESILSDAKQFVRRMSEIDASTRNFIAAGARQPASDAWLNEQSTAVDYAVAQRAEGLSERAAREQAKFDLARWSAIKQWEIMQTYRLEDKSPRVLKYGEVRAWPSAGQVVHQLAPHIVADDRKNMHDQSVAVGRFFSTNWYQVQLTLNAGQRQPAGSLPQDWGYHFTHIHWLEAAHPVRLMQSVIKGWQMRDNEQGTSRRGWQMRIAHPRHIYGAQDGSTRLMDALERFAPGVRNRFFSLMVEESLRMSDRFDLAAWRCPDANTRAECLKAADYVPQPYDAARDGGAVFRGTTHADNFFRLIPLLSEQAVADSTISQLVVWCQRVWPAGDWESLYSPTTTVPPTEEPPPPEDPDPITGLPHPKKKEEVLCYPNPAREVVHLLLPARFGTVKVTIRDLANRKQRVYRRRSAAQRIDLSIRGLNRGFYYLYIDYDSKRIVRRLLIK